METFTAIGVIVVTLLLGLAMCAIFVLLFRLAPKTGYTRVYRILWKVTVTVVVVLFLLMILTLHW